MKKILINGFWLLAVVMILNLSASAQIKTGAWRSAETDESRVVAAANFAVEKRAETNTEQEDLTLDSIDKAEMKTVAGIMFRLCLTVSLDEESQQVEAEVHQDLKGQLSLKSWTVKDCGGDKSQNANENPTIFQAAFYFLREGRTD